MAAHGQFGGTYSAGFAGREVIAPLHERVSRGPRPRSMTAGSGGREPVRKRHGSTPIPVCDVGSGSVAGRGANRACRMRRTRRASNSSRGSTTSRPACTPPARPWASMTFMRCFRPRLRKLMKAPRRIQNNRRSVPSSMRSSAGACLPGTEVRVEKAELVSGDNEGRRRRLVSTSAIAAKSTRSLCMSCEKTTSGLSPTSSMMPARASSVIIAASRAADPSIYDHL